MQLQDIAMNPEIIRAFYPNGPCLDKIVLHEVTLICDGPVLRFRLDLQDLPPAPPKKWSSSFNRAQMTIDFIGVADVEIDGWGTTAIGDLKLQKEGNSIAISFHGAGCKISALSECAYIQKITGYQNGAEPLRAGGAGLRPVADPGSDTRRA
jgi:hypothetical protein